MAPPTGRAAGRPADARAGVSLPRLLTIMGSGETSPTMTAVHSDLLASLGPPPVPAVLLDTPYGFQENASEITQRALTYFRENVRHEIGVASFRSAEAATPLEYETALSRLRRARYVFSGPGSPSYALRQWRGSAVPRALAEKLRDGGCVTFSSAAASTLGRMALPVYEVYKVGHDPEWLEGLDLLGVAGIDGAVIPHFNNAEGGTHDTRYCYMGERRLRLLEERLPGDAVIVGVDEHTACILDLAADTATVRGNGRLTIRINGAEWYVERGETVPVDTLRRGGGFAPRTSGAAVATGGPDPATSPAAAAATPFNDGVEQRVATADAALEGRRVDEALAALLDLDRHLWEWSRETFASDEMDRARSLQRGLLVRLGELARGGARDPREQVGPFVEELLELRRRARDERRWSDADSVREALARLGVEVRDVRGGGAEWDLEERARHA